MKNIATIILVLLILTVLGLVFTSFQVRETELALVTRFRKPTRQIAAPGLRFRLPWPIERVYKYDARMRVLEGDPVETTTRAAVPIIVSTYVVWEINEPLSFYNSVGSVREAESFLLSQTYDTQNRIIGLHYFGEFVNSDPERVKFAQIEDEMFKTLKAALPKDYGIEVRKLGIRQFKVSEDVSKSVFERMKAERTRRTLTTIAQGNAEASKIRTDAERKKTELLVTAEARARAIQGEGDAEAAKYYKMLEAQPELATFLRDTEALKNILKERSTIVIRSDADPFRLLKVMPRAGTGAPEK